MRISLKNLIVPSIPLAVFLIGSCFVLWMSAFVGTRYSTFVTQNTSVVESIQSLFLPNSLLTNLVCIVLTLFNAFLVAQINTHFTIIRTRTFLPVFIFTLLIGTWNRTHVTIGAHMGLTFLILALFYFFSMSRDRKASEESFMGSFLISISSLLINPFIFIIPVCWIGFMMFQSLSLRTFLASVLGMLAPWVLYLSAIYLFKHEFNFYQLLNLNINSDISISNLTLPEVIYSALISIMMIVSIFGMFSITNSDAINTRNKLNFLLLLLLSVVILALIFRNQFISFLPLIALVYSLLISHPLTIKQNNFNGILFLIFCLLNLAFVISKYFII